MVCEKQRLRRMDHSSASVGRMQSDRATRCTHLHLQSHGTATVYATMSWPVWLSSEWPPGPLWCD